MAESWERDSASGGTPRVPHSGEPQGEAGQLPNLNNDVIVHSQGCAKTSWGTLCLRKMPASPLAMRLLIVKLPPNRSDTVAAWLHGCAVMWA